MESRKDNEKASRKIFYMEPVEITQTMIFNLHALKQLISLMSCLINTKLDVVAKEVSRLENKNNEFQLEKLDLPGDIFIFFIFFENFL